MDENTIENKLQKQTKKALVPTDDSNKSYWVFSPRFPFLILPLRPQVGWQQQYLLQQ